MYVIGFIDGTPALVWIDHDGDIWHGWDLVETDKVIVLQCLRLAELRQLARHFVCRVHGFFRR